MSVNYNEQTGVGQMWQRCYEVRISNPLRSTPKVLFNEEKVINIEGSEITQPAGFCEKWFNSQEVVPIVNPETGMLTGGSITHYDLYVYLYSLYLKTAEDRDIALQGSGVSTISAT